MNREQLIWQGKRVELHPGCDRWMRGDRFGEVITAKRGRNGVVLGIRMDKSNTIHRTSEDRVTLV